MTKKSNTRPMLVPIAFGALYLAIAAGFFILLLTLASCEAEAGWSSYTTQTYGTGNDNSQSYTSGYNENNDWESYTTQTYGAGRNNSQSYTSGYDGDGDWVNCSTMTYGEQSYTNCY